MNDQQPDRVAADAATAKAVVDHLLAVTAGRESDAWRRKFFAIQRALGEGRLRDALREESKHWGRIKPTWIVSRELDKQVEQACGNLAYELTLPNPGKKEIRVDQLSKDVTERGTLEEEEERSTQRLIDSFQRDPIEDDPDFKPLLEHVNARINEKFQDHPGQGLLGFCHVVWDEKKRVLLDEYGIDWRTPQEMNPYIRFD